MTLPFALTGVAADINRNPGAARLGFVPTAVDNMLPGNPFITGLQAIPVVPSVKVNSIIAVEGEGEAAYVREHNKDPGALAQGRHDVRAGEKRDQSTAALYRLSDTSGPPLFARAVEKLEVRSSRFQGEGVKR